MTPATATAPHDSPVSLVRLAAPAVAGTAVQKGRIPLPAELIICPWGESRDLAGNPVIVNETTVSELAANQSRYGFDEVALDFGHNTVPPVDAAGKPLKAPEPLPIAAMGKLSVVAGKGIIFTPTSWTTDGEAYYTGRHYKDLSPTVGKNEKGEVNFIHSVALTRAGQIANLHAFSAGGLPVLTHLATPAPTMENTTDYRALLIAQLKLSEDATDEQIIAAASAPMSSEEEVPQTEELAAPAAPNIIALAARIDGMERSNLIAEAARSGKVIPLSAESLAVTPLTVLKELIEKTPATVPLSSTTPLATTAELTPKTTALSAEEAVVAARLGYTAEQFRAANPV
jgi:phage I-like protein